MQGLGKSKRTWDLPSYVGLGEIEREAGWLSCAGVSGSGEEHGNCYSMQGLELRELKRSWNLLSYARFRTAEKKIRPAILCRLRETEMKWDLLPLNPKP